VAQELMLHGIVDFASVDVYRRFSEAMYEWLNAGHTRRWPKQLAMMKELPERRMESALSPLSS
jgi:hypothetical protein